MTAPLTIPPARVIELWNIVAEDTGTLTQTLVKFSGLLLAEASTAKISCKAAPDAAISPPVVFQHHTETQDA